MITVLSILEEAANLGLKADRAVPAEDDDSISIYFFNDHRFGEIEYSKDDTLVGLLNDRQTGLLETFDIPSNPQAIKSALERIKKFLEYEV